MSPDARGLIRWRAETRHDLLVAPAVSDRLVVTVGLAQSSRGRVGFLDAWDRETGQRRWSYGGSSGIGGGVLATPAIVDRRLYFGTGDGTLR